MTIYAADVMDLAKPISKKTKKTKTPLTPPTSETSNPVEKVEKKEKKPLTEKQLAAIQKAQETRKRKREEAQKQKIEEDEQIKKTEQEIALKKAEIEEKKEARKLKRKQKVMDKVEQETIQQEESVEEQVEQEIKNLKKVKKPRDRNTPPTWFAKYIEGVKKEQAKNGEKKPVKQIQEEASQVAKEKWDNGLVRDRLENEVNSHMNRMYTMIFGNRVLR